MQWEVLHGDCREKLRDLPDASIDAIVTDPPYGLEFMGKEWDAPWKQTSGGFSSPGIGDRKTDWPSYKGSNRNRCANCKLLIGQGGSRCKCDVPKPEMQDASRMLAFQLWTEEWAREALRVLKPGGHLLAFSGSRTYHRMTVAIEDAGFEIRDQIMWVYGSGFPKSKNLDGDWQGWGTALKPAHEPICVARKPLIGTVAENVLAHGTGALNIDASRVPMLAGDGWDVPNADLKKVNPARAGIANGTPTNIRHEEMRSKPAEGGRWPANLIHDGSDEVLALTGEAARFFYCPKASKADRAGSKHPTVKPIALMAYLVRLVTPPGGTVLDPFAGSGTTLEAAVKEGFRVIGIEQDETYIGDIFARMERLRDREPANADLFNVVD